MSKIKERNLWDNQHVSFYAEAGSMLRHFSSCRMAILSLSFPICFTILGWSISSDGNPKLRIFLLAAEGFLFFYALMLSIFFSRKYEQTRKILVKIEVAELPLIHTNISSTSLKGKVHFDRIDKSLLFLGLLVHAIFYLYCF